MRITDFGLAVAAGEDVPEADVSGTPPYMAPEQFAGKGASVRSDIYALGLVFYEVFTGRRAFEAKTLAELRAKKETSSPTAPSEIARDIDPIIERVILRCIEKDPRQRPASAAQVAAALPGGDPLAAALAAGETPSPEMVAASGSTEGLKPWIAWACLAFIILGIGVAVLLSRQASLIQRVPVENHPEALVAKARNILKDLGYGEPPADSAFGFETNKAYFQYVEKNDRSPARFGKIPAFAIQFWYRQSPNSLTRLGVDLLQTLAGGGVTADDPPFMNNGESVLRLDSRGNLIGFCAIPPEQSEKSVVAQQPDWGPLFKAAGLDSATCTPVEPDSSYLPYVDSKKAWTAALPDFPGMPIRIEAAAWKGKPVLWKLNVDSGGGFPVSGVSSSASKPEDSISGIPAALPYTLLAVTIVGLLFARRNLRIGRGDRRGATRLACFIFLTQGIAWIFTEHHVASSRELNLFYLSAPIWLWFSASFWVLYIALEPFMRRHLPDWLVGWSRVLAANLRDPLVGRDLLAGCVFGVLLALINYIRFPLAALFGAPQMRPSNVLLSVIEGRGIAGTVYLFSGAHAVISYVLG